MTRSIDTANSLRSLTNTFDPLAGSILYVEGAFLLPDEADLRSQLAGMLDTEELVLLNHSHSWSPAMVQQVSSVLSMR